MAERRRDVLLVVLAVAAGATDATAFERLGNVFGSVVTGNLILLGIGAVKRGGSLTSFAGTALAGYAVGVLVTAPRKSGGDHVWPVGAMLALGVDLLALVAFTVGWEIVGGRPSHTMRIVLLAIAAAAMGAQSSAVRRLGQVSTTYLTSTLTGLVESIAGRRWSQANTRGLAIIAAAVAGAAAAVALLLHARDWVPALQLIPLTVVIIGSWRLIDHRDRS